MVALNPFDGDHAYVDPPLAVKVVLPPKQIGAGVLTDILGRGFNVTTTLVEPTQPLLSVPVTV